MKKIIFSSILIFGLAIFLPISTNAQVVVKSKERPRTTKKVKIKKQHPVSYSHGVKVKTRNKRVVVKRPSRPKVVVKHPNYTRRNYIWLEGYWEWNSYYNHYIWKEGRWVRKKRGYHWVSGFWEPTPNGYFWVEGYWAR